MKSISPSLYSFNDNDENCCSSNIDKVKYCNYTNTMIIKFSGGGVYLYSALPPSVYRSFLIAESKGSYFAKKIKDVYPFLKLPS